jgi:hypothetical protein
VDIVASIRCPGFAKAGSSAVIITAAEFFPFKEVVEFVVTPNWLIIACIDCKVKGELPSPVPGKPTTIPYPTSWFARTPAIEVKSFRRSALAIGKHKPSKTVAALNILKLVILMFVIFTLIAYSPASLAQCQKH